MTPSGTPWKTKREWLNVFQDAYSCEYERTKKALEVLNDWKLIMGKSFRPGMDCTRGLLQVTLKDDNIFPNTRSALKISDLQLMYSAEIMRFLNIVCDSGTRGGSDRKISFYARAKELQIPDWVVNLRHQAAHRNDLPPISLLRKAVQFILLWLEMHYWEVEKAGMIEIILEDVRMVLNEKLPCLLGVYVLLKEQNILGFKNINDIQDPDVKILILKVNEYSLTEVRARCTPWDMKQSENYTINMTKFNKLPITKAIYYVLKLVKQYMDVERMDSICPLSILVERMIDDSIDHNGMRRDVWNSLLRAMHSWYRFHDLIRQFFDLSLAATGERAYQAGMWCAQLCKALQKRFKVESLREYLYNQGTHGKASTRRLINLNTTELGEFKKLFIKKKLNILDKSDSTVNACLFLRVEEKNEDLRDVLRLKEAIFPDHWQVIELMETIALNPSEFTEQCLLSLYDILKYPFGLERLRCLIALTKIYNGEGVTVKKGRRLYRESHLKQALIAQTNEGVKDMLKQLQFFKSWDDEQQMETDTPPSSRPQDSCVLGCDTLSSLIMETDVPSGITNDV